MTHYLNKKESEFGPWESVTLRIDSYERINRLMFLLDQLDGDFWLYSEPGLINARSLMGMFMLDLTGCVLLYGNRTDMRLVFAELMYSETLAAGAETDECSLGYAGGRSG